eukprot:TRINITY_DN45461_c0_g2_i2.p1 TRINITY_DN45461_c0_g2~~TRINITY_DN45461_c0_g2_i2.p1  ORF type:complete len:479 (-),score=83.72 TRINITY_DN45461_c0_g2_i2:109-1545(-)
MIAVVGIVFIVGVLAFAAGVLCGSRGLDQAIAAVACDEAKAWLLRHADLARLLLPVLVALVAALVVEATVLFARRRRAAKNEGAAQAQLRGRATSSNSISGFRTCLKQAATISVQDSEMDRFEEIVNEINQVQQGIFYGELGGGGALKNWPRGAFRQALKETQARAPASAWPDGGKNHDPLDDVAYSQRLIAAELSVDTAVRLVQDYRSYRAELHGGFTSPPLLWLHWGMTIVPCEDRLGRPLIVIRSRYHRPGHAALFRAGLRATLDCVKLHFLHKRTGKLHETNPLEQYAMVWDFEGAGVSNLDWEAFKITIDEGHLHYPNMGSQVYVLNVSLGMRWFWQAASKMMHPRLLRKCQLVRPADVADCMRKVVKPELLCPAYGGTGAPWPGPKEARSLEDQAGELMANVLANARVIPQGAKPLRKSLALPDVQGHSNGYPDEDIPDWPTPSYFSKGCGGRGDRPSVSGAPRRAQSCWCW